MSRPLSLLAAAGLLLGSVLVAPAAAAAAPPPQEPGVTLRVFDVQVPLNEICTLKPGQTPNVDKLMPTINWTTDRRLRRFEDNFVSQVIGNINIATAGTLHVPAHQRRRLPAADRRHRRHRPRRAARRRPPKDGTVTLTTGYHALRIDHFERGGDQQLTLEWRRPASIDVRRSCPTRVLSTDAGVVRVTAPGRKECEGVTDAPGDGLPLTAVHPNYTLTNLRPTGFQPQVTAMDWLPDGRLAITTWGGTRQRARRGLPARQRHRRDRARARSPTNGSPAGCRSRWASRSSTARSTCRRSTS